MKKSKSSDKQVVSILPANDIGGPVAAAISKQRNRGKSELVDRKNKARMTPAETRQLRLLEDENRKLKQLVADLTLNKVLLQGALARKLSATNETIHGPRKPRSGSANSTRHLSDR